MREFLANKEEPIRERAKKLYEFMVEERKRLQSQEEDLQRDNTRPLSQGLVDLIHGMGYHDLSLQKGLKSKDGKERLSAFLKILSERDSFAMELGFEDHFAQVLKEFEIPFPTGVEEVSLVDTLQHLEDQMIQEAQSMDDVNSDNLISDNTTFQRTIRHLSLMESPFRSCLGGSDCASRTYLTKALDPNYHYFTLTDETGYSSGHITIVLGTANKGSQEVQVAFVDKVQNIDNKDIAILIEGVRRSVEEKGYLLALPKDLGGHNGISNEKVTRDFIQKNIATDMVAKGNLTDFTPHPHSYSFDSGYSRSDDNLLLRSVLPLSSIGGTDIYQGELILPWRVADFDLEGLIEGSIHLKRGSVEDQIRYIQTMGVLKKAGLELDSLFDETLTNWLEDSMQDLRLRKQALMFKWKEDDQSLPKLLHHFDSTQQVVILQNLLDTPRYRRFIFKNKKELIQLAFLMRENQKLRKALLKEYLPEDTSLPEQNLFRTIVSAVLDAKGISEEVALEAIEGFEKNLLGPFNITRLSAVMKVVGENHIDTFGKQELGLFLVEKIHGEEASDKALNEGLDFSSSHTAVGMVRQILSFAKGADLQEADLKGANLRGAKLLWAKLRGVDLYKTDLRSVDLQGANLYKADLRGVDLRGVDLKEANLKGAKLYGAKLRGADLQGANLYEANLYEASLKEANLQGANLQEANLYGRTLKGRTLKGRISIRRISEGWISKRRISKGRISKGRISMGQSSKRRISKGRSSMGQSSKRRISKGRISKRRISMGRTLMGRISEGRISEGRISKRRISMERISKRRISMGRISMGRTLKRRVSIRRISEGRISKGRISKGRTSKGRISKG